MDDFALKEVDFLELVNVGERQLFSVFVCEVQLETLVATSVIFVQQEDIFIELDMQVAFVCVLRETGTSLTAIAAAAATAVLVSSFRLGHQRPFGILHAL